jgi:hypothetical protein
LTTLGFVNCDLTDASAGRIKAFLLREDVGDRAPKKKAKLELRELDLQCNSFSYRLLLDLGDALSEASLALLDLRDNQEIDPRIIANIRKVVKHLEIHVDNCQSFEFSEPHLVVNDLFKGTCAIQKN